MAVDQHGRRPGNGRRLGIDDGVAAGFDQLGLQTQRRSICRRPIRPAWRISAWCCLSVLTLGIRSHSHSSCSNLSRCSTRYRSNSCIVPPFLCVLRTREKKGFPTVSSLQYNSVQINGLFGVSRFLGFARLGTSRGLGGTCRVAAAGDCPVHAHAGTVGTDSNESGSPGVLGQRVTESISLDRA